MSLLCLDFLQHIVSKLYFYGYLDSLDARSVYLIFSASPFQHSCEPVVSTLLVSLVRKLSPAQEWKNASIQKDE